MADTAETTSTTTETTKVEEGSAGKTLTQEQVDAIVTDRLARERKKWSEREADLKAKADRLAEIEASELSESEKAIKRAEAAEAKASELESRVKAANTRSAVLAEAAKADRNVVDPEGALAFLTGADSEFLELDGDGNPTNMADAMDKLLERRPYLVRQGAEVPKPTPSADQGARGTNGVKQVTESELATMKPEEIVKARQEGRLVSLLGA